MRRTSIASQIIAAALMLSVAASGALAQRRVNPNRPAGGFNNPDPQLGRQRNRLPGNRPLGGDQLRPRANPRDPNFRRDLQRRLMQEIGLTDDQRARMQEIRRGYEDDAIAVGRRIRQARALLDREIMSEPYNEATVSRAIDELAAAQAEKTRLEARIRAQLRRVLTPDQVLRYHEIERRLRRQMREQVQQDRQDRELGALDFRGPDSGGPDSREPDSREPDFQGHGLSAPGQPLPGPFEEIDLIALLLFIF